VLRSFVLVSIWVQVSGRDEIRGVYLPSAGEYTATL